MARNHSRTAVEGHIVERRNEKGLLGEVGLLQRSGEDIDPPLARRREGQQVGAVGQGNHRLADGLCAEQPMPLNRRHLHLVAASAEHPAEEAAGIVERGGGTAARHIAVERRRLEPCKHGVQLGRHRVGGRHHEQRTAFLDPSGQPVGIAGRQLAQPVENDKARLAHLLLREAVAMDKPHRAVGSEKALQRSRGGWPHLDHSDIAAGIDSKKIVVVECDGIILYLDASFVPPVVLQSERHHGFGRGGGRNVERGDGSLAPVDIEAYRHLLGIVRAEIGHRHLHPDTAAGEEGRRIENHCVDI